MPPTSDLRPRPPTPDPDLTQSLTAAAKTRLPPGRATGKWSGPRGASPAAARGARGSLPGAAAV